MSIYQLDDDTRPGRLNSICEHTGVFLCTGEEASADDKGVPTMSRSQVQWTLVVALQIVVLSTFSPCASAASTDQWADLSGCFVYDGTPPTPARLVVNNACGQHQPVDESLVVGPTGGLANVVVYVRSPNVKVHPDLANASGDVVLDNKHCRFEPHVLPIQLGQVLLIKNSDPFAHNTNIQPPSDQGINPLLAPGMTVSYNFHRKQNLPVPATCNIHPWMRAYVLPRDNPYTAVTDADGNFTIKNLPAGEKLEFQVWHEKAGYLEPEGKNWGKGRFEMTLQRGDNELGAIKIGAAAFEKK